ncbi:MAG: glycosyltransferase family 2 protein [Treponema sp.]|nr:glycosyltransferase family 2 protein [Treponema sp.]
MSKTITQNPLVSVCMPVYNTGSFIKQCLESLFTQTIADSCEFIIVNDCTPDNAMQVVQDVVKDYPHCQVKIINHEHNRGLAAARNSGLQNATGTYCIFIDSDDWVKNDYLECMVRKAEEEKADIVICECSDCQKIAASSAIDCIQYELEHTYIPVTIWAKLIRRDVFVLNNLTWVEGINVGEDVIISCKLFFYANKVVALSGDWYNYRMDIGFVTKMKRLGWLEQKKREFDELTSFFADKGIYARFEHILSLRKAELRYEYLKQSPVFSVKKFCAFYPEIPLVLLLDHHQEYNSALKRLFIQMVDKKRYFVANALLCMYQIKSLLRR